MVRERRGRRILSALAIFLTAIALQRACTMPWASGAAAGGPRYVLSAVGLSRLPPSGVGPSTDCRWWPRYGDAALCAPRSGGEAAFDRLRIAYPLLQVGLWLAVASLLLQALRVPRTSMVQAALPALVSVGVGVAIRFAWRGAHEGLASLDGVVLQSGAFGLYAAVAALVLSATSAILLATSFHDTPAA